MMNTRIQNLKKRFYQFLGIAMVLLANAFSLAHAQNENTETNQNGNSSSHKVRVIKPRQKVSPLAMATFQGLDSTYLKVTYGQPYKKGREIFGNIVPYGEIWRTGANEATELTITKDVNFVNTPLKAGTYTLFSIPEKDNWTIILNKVLGQWGAYKYDECELQNVLEVSVPVEKSRNIYEAFTIEFLESRNGTDMYLIWDQTQIVIPIEFLKQ